MLIAIDVNKDSLHSIWNHLVKITKMGTTVIITTHYIEETKQSNKVNYNFFLIIIFLFILLFSYFKFVINYN